MLAVGSVIWSRFEAMADREVDLRTIASDYPEASLRKLWDFFRRCINLETGNAGSGFFLNLIVAFEQRGQISRVFGADAVTNAVPVQHSREERRRVPSLLE